MEIQIKDKFKTWAQSIKNLYLSFWGNVVKATTCILSGFSRNIGLSDKLVGDINRLVELLLFSIKNLWLTFWSTIGSTGISFICLFLAMGLDRIDIMISVLFVLGQTLILPLTGLFILAYIIDTYLIKEEDPKSESKKNESPLNNRIPTAEHPNYKITFVDRLLAFSSQLWPLSVAFLYTMSFVNEYPFLKFMEEQVLRGLILFFTYAPFLQGFITVWVFREVVRRRGPDTRWFGQYHINWLKHFVRYHWCYATCLNSFVQLFMYAYIKIFLPHLSTYRQEIIMTGFLFFILALCTYAMVCALLAIQPRLPGLHKACLYHVGHIKDTESE